MPTAQNAPAGEPRSASEGLIFSSEWARTYREYTGRPCPYSQRQLLAMARDDRFPAIQVGSYRAFAIRAGAIETMVQAVDRRVRGYVDQSAAA